MHGFIATISFTDNLPTLSYKWKPLFDFQPAHTKRSKVNDSFNIEQYTSESFINDKLWIDNDDFFIVTDGLITNIDILCTQYKVDSYNELIKILFKKNIDFFSEFTGNFVGFLWNKKHKTFTAFNNQCGTKKLFYYASDKYIIFSTDLYTLSQTLNQLEIKKSLDIEASYLLLSSGFMHEDYTLIKEVKQIIAGEYALIENAKFFIHTYFDLKNIVETKDSELEIIEKLDLLFDEAIKTEFDFDKKRNLNSYTTISGGLDSRMVALRANDMDYKQVFFNFSEAGYADEIIAKEIAKTYKIDLKQIMLFPESLTAIDDVVLVNDGLTIYIGAGHVFNAIRNSKLTNLGVFHTGIVGDAVLGTSLTEKFHKKPNISDGAYTKLLIENAKSIIEKSISKYNTELAYKTYNLSFQGMNNGFLMFNLISESMSLFLYPSFIKYALSIPPKLAFQQKLYVSWIKKKHKEYADFVWESIGGKPTNNKLLRFYYRYKRAIVKRLPIKTMWRSNLAPEQLWYDKNPQDKSAEK